MGVGLLQPWHLIIILVVVLIIFGAGHLPEVGGALGKGIKDFKEAKDEGVTPEEKAAATPRPIQAARTAPLSGGRRASRPDAVAPGSEVTVTRADEV